MDLKFDKIAVTVLLFTDFNKFLVVSRKDNHDSFGLPGGKVESTDENTRYAAVRELKEETGIEVSADDIFLIYAQHNKGFMNLTYVCHKRITESDIKTDEPHIVKIGTFDDLISDKAAFREYNALVLNSYLNWLKANKIYE